MGGVLLMIRLLKTTAFILLCLSLAGCGGKHNPTTKRNPLRLLTEHTSISKDKNGDVQLLGNTPGNHFGGPGGGGGVGYDGYMISWELTSLEKAKATFRFSDDKGNEQDVELELGESKDIFFKEETIGLRFEVVKIGPERDFQGGKSD
jgi:hypothetical protein